MTARPIWKGALQFDGVGIPVKLYSAVQDRTVHFRLLHKKDHEPIKQTMVNPETDDVVPAREALKAYRAEEDELVLLHPEELEKLKPEKSRDIDILQLLPPQAIDHRWYDRPYYLGPDGSDDRYMALVEALRQQQQEGLAHWVMRNKEYFGALRLFQGYPMLISLRYANQVLPAEELRPSTKKSLDERELRMAKELIGMLEARFEPGEFHDDYRERVMELIEKKQRGGRTKRPSPSRKTPPEDLTQALEASLKRVRHG